MAYMRGWYPQRLRRDHLDEPAHRAATPTIVEASEWPLRLVWPRLDLHRAAERAGLERSRGGTTLSRSRSTRARPTCRRLLWHRSTRCAALAFLHTYGVRYVYVGLLERTCYTSAGQQRACAMTGGALAANLIRWSGGRAAGCLSARPNTTIYEVVG